MKSSGRSSAPMALIMKVTFAASLVCSAAAVCIYIRLGADWAKTCAISLGMVAFHMGIRFLSPAILYLFFRRKYNPYGGWFRQKRWEPALYRRLNVQGWKTGISSFDPSEFDLRRHSLEQIVQNMCHAEAVHELIVIMSLMSVFWAVPFGELLLFLITALLSALLDSVFVVLQRYNRPRMISLMERQKERLLRKQNLHKEESHGIPV